MVLAYIQIPVREAGNSGCYYSCQDRTSPTPTPTPTPTVSQLRLRTFPIISAAPRPLVKKTNKTFLFDHSGRLGICSHSCNVWSVLNQINKTRSSIVKGATWRICAYCYIHIETLAPQRTRTENRVSPQPVHCNSLWASRSGFVGKTFWTFLWAIVCSSL